MVATRSAAKKAPEVAAPPTLNAPPKRAPRKKAAAAKPAPPTQKPIPTEKSAPKATISSKRREKLAIEPAPITTEAPKKTRGRKPAAAPASAPVEARSEAPVKALVRAPPAKKTAPTLTVPTPTEPPAPISAPTRATRARRNVLVSPLKTTAKKRPTTRVKVPAKKTEEEVREEAKDSLGETQIPEETAGVAETVRGAPKSVSEAPKLVLKSPKPALEQQPVLTTPPAIEQPTSPAPIVERPISPTPTVERPISPTPVMQHFVIKRPILEQHLVLPPVKERPVIPSVVLENPAIPSPVREQRLVVPSPVQEQRVIVPPSVLAQRPVLPPLILEQHFILPRPISQQQCIVTPPAIDNAVVPSNLEQFRISPPLKEDTMLPPPFFASPVKSALRSPKKLEKLEAKTPKKSVSWTAPQDDFESSLLVQDGPLTGTVFYVDVNSNGKSQNHLFTGLLEDLGAQVLRDWTSNSMGLTHVLFKDGSPETLENVLDTHGAVKCVNVGWALDCEKEKKRLDEAPYLVNLAPMTAPIMQPKKLNPYTPAKTPSRFLLDDDTSIASIPNTPTSSEWDRSIAYDDKENIKDKENSFTSSEFFAQIAKKGQQSCPPKSLQADNPLKFGSSFLNKSPMKTPLKPSFIKKTPIRPWTSVKRKAENIGGITMAPPKKLRWD